MCIVGLDVCKDRVVCCALTTVPPEPRQFYLENEFLTVYASAAGLSRLLELKPVVAVLEPTGVNYSKFWCTKLAEMGCEIILVGHKQLRTYRDSLGLPDKDDEADALALACYYLQHQYSPLRFVRVRDPVVAKMRDCVLRLHHLNRVQSPVINRVKQDLAWQFPERAKARLDAAVFWRWLAEEGKSGKYDAELESSAGLGLHLETRNNARLICTLHARERALELELRELMNDARFLPYRQVFSEFGFGERVEALILSQIYPLENYLKEGKPEIIKRKGKVSGKKTKRNLSLRRFKKALGVAPTRENSGDTQKTKKAGSQLCRTALWQWVFTRIEVQRSRPNTPVAQALVAVFEAEKASNTPIKLVRSRVFARAVALLFQELVAAINQEPHI